MNERDRKMMGLGSHLETKKPDDKVEDWKSKPLSEPVGPQQGTIGKGRFDNLEMVPPGMQGADEILSEQIESSEQVELDETLAKNKLLEVLNKPNVPGQIPELVTCRSSVTEHTSKYESNFGFYKIFEPKMADAKTLELFCGFNTAKQYLKQNNLPGEVTGVDIENEVADIKTDVAKLPETLKPEGQFDIVTSIGAHPGFENFADDAAYLKEDGLYVHGMDEE